MRDLHRRRHADDRRAPRTRDRALPVRLDPSAGAGPSSSRSRSSSTRSSRSPAAARGFPACCCSWWSSLPRRSETRDASTARRSPSETRHAKRWSTRFRTRPRWVNGPGSRATCTTSLLTTFRRSRSRPRAHASPSRGCPRRAARSSRPSGKPRAMRSPRCAGCSVCSARTRTPRSHETPQPGLARLNELVETARAAGTPVRLTLDGAGGCAAARGGHLRVPDPAGGAHQRSAARSRRRRGRRARVQAVDALRLRVRDHGPGAVARADLDGHGLARDARAGDHGRRNVDRPAPRMGEASPSRPSCRSRERRGDDPCRRRGRSGDRPRGVRGAPRHPSRLQRRREPPLMARRRSRSVARERPRRGADGRADAGHGRHRGHAAGHRPTASAPPRVIVLTTFDLDEYVYDALGAGASGFLLKDVRAEMLFDAVRVVAAGDALLAPTVTRRLDRASSRASDRRARRGPTRWPSSPRARPRSCGSSPKACRTVRSPSVSWSATQTVKTHVSRILTKLGVRDRTQAVVAAYEYGLVTPRVRESVDDRVREDRCYSSIGRPGRRLPGDLPPSQAFTVAPTSANSPSS